MWKKKHRGSPLGVILGVAGAALAVIVVRSVLPDLIRYSRIHRM
jgi:hypothetical protein